MEYFAIRHIPTGKFLPNYGSRRGRGGLTNDEPEDPSYIPPRLFTSVGSAKCALTYWLLGAHFVTRYIDEYGGCDEDWHVEQKPHRKRSEMELVKVELFVI